MIISKVLIGISPWDSVHRQEKTLNLDKRFFLILLHNFKVPLLLIPATAYKEAISDPEIRPNLVKNSSIFSKVHFSKFAFHSTYFDELCRIVYVYYRRLTAKFQPNWCRQCCDTKFFHMTKSFFGKYLGLSKNFFFQRFDLNNQNSDNWSSTVVLFPRKIILHFSAFF